MEVYELIRLDLFTMKKKHRILIFVSVLAFIAALISYQKLFSRLIIVDGYTNKTSYFPGDTLTAFINSKKEKHNAKVSLYSIGGRKVDDIICDLKLQEINEEKPWENGFGYHATFKYTIPELKSGLYLWEKKIEFVIKSKDENVD